VYSGYDVIDGTHAARVRREMYKTGDMDTSGIIVIIQLQLTTGRRSNTDWKMEYNLRGVPRTDYKDLADVKLPRARPKTIKAKLYPVDIVEGRGSGESTLHLLSLVLRPACCTKGDSKVLAI